MSDNNNKNLEYHKVFLKELYELTRTILHSTNQLFSQTKFYYALLKELLSFSGFDFISLKVKDKKQCYNWEICPDDRDKYFYKDTNYSVDEFSTKYENALVNLCWNTFEGYDIATLPFITPHGSCWISDIQALKDNHANDNELQDYIEPYINDIFNTIVMLPFGIGNKLTGLLTLKNRDVLYFSDFIKKNYESLAHTLGIAIVDYNAQAALRERVKELTCLYGIAQLSDKPDASLTQIIQGIVELVPPAMQYPSISFSKIELDDNLFRTSYYPDKGASLSVPIIINKQQRGFVEVIYEYNSEEDRKKTFLDEEHSLLNAIAREVALIVERREAEEANRKLQEQLRHADRLATIGQLSAGVAHELNEPIGSILGFAQLAQKSPQLPSDINRDLNMIIASGLHAREVIKKLMLFARQTPANKVEVNLDELIEDSMFFLEARCRKANIAINHVHSIKPPIIIADTSQFRQVIVNLMVNAIQAMPDGGQLIIKTTADDNDVKLIVKDTGKGIKEDNIKKIFMPFFTTKDVGQGTGLGLAVVHGILTAHNADIYVDSIVNKGTTFIISIPLNSKENKEEVR